MLKRLERERRDERLIAILKDCRDGIELLAEYWDRPQDGLEEYEAIELESALSVFGLNFAREGVAMFFSKQPPTAAPAFRSRMMKRVDEIERMLGYPRFPDLGGVKP
jgi:hypothetical protein